MITKLRVKPAFAARGLAKAPTNPYEYPEASDDKDLFLIHFIDLRMRMLMPSDARLDTFQSWGKYWWPWYFNCEVVESTTFAQRRETDLRHNNHHRDVLGFDHWHNYFQSKPEAARALGLMMGTKGDLYFRPDPNN